MDAAKDLYASLEKVLDDLIENAKQLKELSQQVIVEKELEDLQQKQEHLVKELKVLDERYQKTIKSSKSASDRWKSLENKLKLFQQLNTAYIENLANSRGVIRFEKSKKP